MANHIPRNFLLNSSYTVKIRSFKIYRKFENYNLSQYKEYKLQKKSDQYDWNKTLKNVYSMF